MDIKAVKLSLLVSVQQEMKKLLLETGGKDVLIT